MRIVDWFAAQAARAEQDLNSLADEQEASLAMQRALAHVERRFERMAADGVIDPAEMAELRRLLERNGVDPKELDSLFLRKSKEGGVELASEPGFGDLVRSVLRDAKADLSDSAANLSYRIQLASGDYTHHNEAASRLLKNTHDAEMSVIRNIVA